MNELDTMSLNDLAIDSRSFHVFECEGVKLLFDRNTSAVCEIGNVPFDLLSLIANGITIKDAIASLTSENAGLDGNELAVAIKALQSRGFFHFRPLDIIEQDGMLKELLDHKSKRIQLLVAQSCNLGCRYCYAWKNGALNQQALMSWETAKAGVDYIVKQSGLRADLHITFFGGEPLLNYPLIQRVVTYCREIENTQKKKFLFEVCTNGTLLTREVTDYLVKNQFLLFISIDGPREMHNANRPSRDGSDLYDQIVENATYAIQQYKANNLTPIKIRANLTKDYNDFFSVGDYLASLGATIIGVGHIEAFPNEMPASNALTPDQIQAGVKIFL